MNTVRVTANLSKELLADARRVSGAGITETLTLALEMLKRSRALEKARALRGKLALDLDLDSSRERHAR